MNKETDTVIFESDVLKRFESLGDNCEFGLVQVAVGVDQLGFFRFNNSGIEALIKVLENEFKDFAEPKNIELEVACNNELIVHVSEYDFRYHTFIQAGTVDEARLLAQQQNVLRFLARKSLDDLRSGEKLFLRKDSDSVSADDMSRVQRALTAYNANNQCLWVRTSDDPNKAGHVERSNKGVLMGYMDRFSNYEDARGFSFCWFELCRSALNTWMGKNPDSGRRAKREVIPTEYRLKSLNDLPERVTPTMDGFILEDAVVHGDSGVVTVGSTAIAETITTGSTFYVKPRHTVHLAAAYHLLSDQTDYIRQSYNEAAFNRFRAQLNPATPATLLIPDRRDFSVLAPLREVANPRIPRLGVVRDSCVQVERLLMCPSRDPMA